TYYLIGRIISVVSDNEFVLGLVGEFGRFIGFKFNYFIGLKWHFNICIILFLLLILSSQLLYYYNHIRGIEPTFVSVFRVMSGSVSPSMIGLYSEDDIKTLMKYKKYFKFLDINIKIIVILTFIFSFSLYILNIEIFKAIL